MSLEGNYSRRSGRILAVLETIGIGKRAVVKNEPTEGKSRLWTPWCQSATLPQRGTRPPHKPRLLAPVLTRRRSVRVWSLTKSEVATTALFVAAVRARENERSDPLFRDELSSLLAGQEGLAWLARSEVDPTSNYHRDSFPYLEVRTRYFDDWALQAVRECEAKQLVLLGAGMDTRAFRLPWPEAFRFWEVDTPELFALKEARLQSAGVRLSCDRIVVEADLTSAGWVGSLLDAGFKKKSPSVWLAEGLFQYLTATDVRQILQGAASVASPGSRFGAEIISLEFLRRRSNQARLQRRKDRGTPWVFGTDDPEALFRPRGWKVGGKVGALEVAMELGRWSASRANPSRRSQAGPPGASFVSATRVPVSKGPRTEK